jgi:hypothetical protein
LPPRRARWILGAHSGGPSGPRRRRQSRIRGASDALAFIPEQPLRYRSPAALVAFVNETARAGCGAQFTGARALPTGTFTDRSFPRPWDPSLDAARSTAGLPAAPVRCRLRERLRLPAIERSVQLLAALVARADASPERIAELGRRGSGSAAPPVRH